VIAPRGEKGEGVMEGEGGVIECGRDCGAEFARVARLGVFTFDENASADVGICFIDGHGGSLWMWVVAKRLQVVE